MNNCFIKVTPKEHQNKYFADYLTMFLECLNEPTVSKHLTETYKIFPEQELIEIDREDDLITPFLVIHYIKILEKIVKKGLKKGYIRETKNLTSKIKGKILVNKTFMNNHMKNRVDKTYCDYQNYTINCLENQILKTALEQSLKYLSIVKNELIGNIIKKNLNAFELVETKEVFESDFIKIKNSPFYCEYKDAISLARLIFKILGYSLQANIVTGKVKIPPFYINMPELFERFVEVKLREKFNNDLICGYNSFDLEHNSYVWGLRPDFIVKNNNMIIDAKYKYWFGFYDNDYLKNDYQQLSLYGRILDLKNDISPKEKQEPKLFFIYPNLITNEIDFENLESNKDFYNIYKLGLKIPYK